MLHEIHPNPWMILPFMALLTLLALAPMFFHAWWERHYILITLSLATVTLIYYLMSLRAGWRVAEAAADYLGFIALIGSLFVVSGGIHIQVKGVATPWGNTLFLLIGALAANVIGTTGASMLLIRPWLQRNHHRAKGYHVVFFIFIVSNCGGCVTPIADPPLFLGYLAGVPFGWTLKNCFLPWAMGISMLLGIFFILDQGSSRKVSRDISTSGHESWRFEGWPNLIFLSIILGSVFISQPIFLRESLMLTAAAGSYFTTPKRIHYANRFNFQPVREVAILFLGIFATMMPVLDWLGSRAGSVLGAHPSPAWFYWGSGALSSVLDNAPTYLGFVNAFFGSFVTHDMIAQLRGLIHGGGAGLDALTGPHAAEIRNAFILFKQKHGGMIPSAPASLPELKMCFLLSNAKFHRHLLAISIGSVFFGAATYIGNGPNFMVRSIAQESRVSTPTFLAYIFKYTLPFLLPTLVVIWLLFFRT